jgi:Tol biopolymer transport system component
MNRSRSRAWTITGSVAVGAAALSASASAPWAEAEPTEAVARCATTQLTGAKPYDGTMALDDDGSHAALLSFAHHPSNSHWEVVLVETATNDLTRITTTQHVSDRGFDSPSISGDGSLVAFSTSFDVTNEREVADTSDQVYLYDVAAETLDQLTFDDDTPEGWDDARHARISADGTHIVFNGDQGDMMGVYRYEIATGEIEPFVEHFPLFTSALDVDADGSHVAFLTYSDLDTGENPDLGPEAFVADDDGVEQLTDSPALGNNGGANAVSIDGDGSHVVYRDHLGAVYRHEVSTGQRVKIGGNPQGGFWDYVYAPDIDASGTRVAFDSGRNLTGQNADGGLEVHVWDNGTVHQVTNAPSVFSASDTYPVISGDGQRVMFTSEANLTGQNGAGVEQLFLACTGGVPPRCDGRAVTVDLRLGQTPTAGNDVILGTGAANVINAGGGNDRVCAGGGNDTVNTGAGNDRVLAGAGNDIVRGGTGTDRLLGEGGKDNLQGQGGTDTLDGGAGADRLNGGPQRDTCIGGTQADTATACEVRRGIP